MCLPTVRLILPLKTPDQMSRVQRPGLRCKSPGVKYNPVCRHLLSVASRYPGGIPSRLSDDFARSLPHLAMVWHVVLPGEA